MQSGNGKSNEKKIERNIMDKQKIITEECEKLTALLKYQAYFEPKYDLFSHPIFIIVIEEFLFKILMLQ